MFYVFTWEAGVCKVNYFLIGGILVCMQILHAKFKIYRPPKKFASFNLKQVFDILWYVDFHNNKETVLPSLLVMPISLVS